MTWSKPHHGVQHLSDTKQGYQVSLEHKGLFTFAYVLQGFRYLASQDFHTLEEAKLWAERKAKELGVML